MQMNFNLFQRNEKLSQDDVGKLLALTGIIFGIWIRLVPPLLAEFPINDGGLFFIMLQSLIQNGFALPDQIFYNGLSIPFAYPPLAFYIGGLISKAFQIPLIELVRWMPGIVTALTVIVFYDLARVMLISEFEAGIATLIFAFTPRALTWFVMGGGLTRSLGEVFLILSIRYVYSLFTEGGHKNLVFASFFCSLVVLTHPEATVHTIIVCLLLWAFYGHNKAGVARAFMVAIGVLVITSLWWVTILVRHGVGPVVSAMQTGDQNPLVFVSNLFFAVTEEPYLTTIAVLGLLGLILKFVQRDYFLPSFYLLPLILEPRNAANVVIIPIALLAAISIEQMILKTLTEINKSKNSYPNHLKIFGAPLLITVFFLSLLINVGYFSLQLSKNHLMPSTLEAFKWVEKNTRSNSTFLILTGDPDSFCDSVQEWFPVFTKRISLTTSQGREWIAGNTFGDYRDYLTNLQKCMENEISCVENVLMELEGKYDYLFIQKAATSKLFCVPRGETYRGGNLILSINTMDSNYINVYKSNDVEIYAIQKK